MHTLGQQRGSGEKDRDSVDQGLCLYWDEKQGAWGFMGLLFIGEFKIQDWELECEEDKAGPSKRHLPKLGKAP